MSLSSAISRNDYVGNGATSVYSFTFKIQDASHVKVIRLDTSNTETVLNLNSDYTITGVGSASGGSITLLAGNLTSGYKLAIVRNIPLKQETDIRNQGAFYPEIHEDVFDRLTSIDQQQQDSIDRSLRLPQSLNPSSFDMELPSNIVASPDSTIVINATGTGLEVGPTIGSISSASTNASNAASSAAAAASSASAAAASASLAASNAAAGLWKDVVFLTNASSPYSVTGSDQGKLFIVDCTSGNVTVNLPLITSLSLGFGWSIGIKKSDSSTNTIIINPNGTDTIDGNASLTLDRQNYGATLLPDIDPSPDKWSSVMFGDVKTLYSPQIYTPTTDILTMTGQGSTPSNPSAGNFKTYIKNNDKKLYVLDSTGTETQLGSNSSGGVNYVTNSSADNDTTGWATYNDAAGTSPVDGTGGTPTATWTRTTSSPLRGQGSFLLTKGATNRQGDGASFDFTIDSSDKAKCLQISFEYIVSSGTFVAGNPSDLSSAGNSDVTVWLYDVTNSTLIQPSNFRLYSNSSTISDKFSATFQTSATGSSYRLIFHIGSTSANAYTLKFDNISVSPSTYAFGSPVTDVKTYTPTLNSNTNVSNNSGWYARVGDCLVGRVNVAYSGAGAASRFEFSLPSGLSIDTSKVKNVTYGSNTVGTFSITTSTFRVGFATASSSTSIGIIRDSDTGTFLSSSFGAGDIIEILFNVPILGWSSSVQMSDGFDARIIVGGLQSSGSTSVGGTTTKILLTTAIDSSGGITDQTNSRFLINSAGYYVFTASTSHTQVGTLNSRLILSVYKNGSEVWSSHSTNGNIASNTVVFTTTTPPIAAKGGDYFEMYFKNDSGSNASVTGSFYAQKLQGPQTISATETIVASYGVGSGQTLTSAAIIKGDTKVVDTHGAYNTSTGVYTVPAAGLYRISHTFFSITATSAWNVQIRKNTSTLLTSTDTIPQFNGGTSIVNNRSMNAPLTPYIGYFNAGDTIDFYNSGAIATGNLYANAASNYFTIERIK